MRVVIIMDLRVKKATVLSLTMTIVIMIAIHLKGSKS